MNDFARAKATSTKHILCEGILSLSKSSAETSEYLEEEHLCCTIEVSNDVLALPGDLLELVRTSVTLPHVSRVDLPDDPL